MSYTQKHINTRVTFLDFREDNDKKKYYLTRIDRKRYMNEEEYDTHGNTESAHMEYKTEAAYWASVVNACGIPE